jgi:hypothetical protein
VPLCVDIEIVPDRYTFKGQPIVAGWGVVPAECCVAQASSTSGGMLLLMTSGDLLFAQGASAPRTFAAVPVTRGVIGANASLILNAAGLPIGAATPTKVLAVQCSALEKPGGGCVVHSGSPAALGVVYDTATVPTSGMADAAAETVTFIASATGLWRAAQAAGSAWALTQVITPLVASGAGPHDNLDPVGFKPPPSPMTAVAATATVVSAGNSVKMWDLDPGTGKILRWSWVTAPGFGAGGVYDDAVRCLAFHQSTGDLYVGADIALNIRSASDGEAVTRVAGADGLPYANISTIVTAVTEPLSGAYSLNIICISNTKKWRFSRVNSSCIFRKQSCWRDRCRPAVAGHGHGHIRALQ